MANERLQGRERNRSRARPELFGDDERERHVGLVLLRRVVDDLHLFPLADHLGDLEQRDVGAALRVVELAVRVALDDSPGPRRGALGNGFLVHWRIRLRLQESMSQSVKRASEAKRRIFPKLRVVVTLTRQ